MTLCATELAKAKSKSVGEITNSIELIGWVNQQCHSRRTQLKVTEHFSVFLRVDSTDAIATILKF